MNNQYVSQVIDLTNPEKNVIYNMTHDEAVNILRSGDAETDSLFYCKKTCRP